MRDFNLDVRLPRRLRKHLIAGAKQAGVVRARLGADWQQQRDVKPFGRQRERWLHGRTLFAARHRVRSEVELFARRLAAQHAVSTEPHRVVTLGPGLDEPRIAERGFEIAKLV